jgi:HAD superfamily hydrolase (TIGR01484 family)
MFRFLVLVAVLSSAMSLSMESYHVRFRNFFSEIDKGRPFIFFCDLDGTVSDNTDDICLHPLVLPAVKKIIEAGHIFVPSSGRSFREVKEAFKDLPDIPMSGNDGLVMQFSAQYQMFYSKDHPNFDKFKIALKDFTRSMSDVCIRDMDNYMTLMISDKHPQRKRCDEFFEIWEQAVSDYSNGLEMISYRQTNTITMEPRDNLGKDGVINMMLPILTDKYKLTQRKPFVVALGDTRNDEPALKLVKKIGGAAFFVHRGELKGVPDYATEELINVEDCAGLLNAVANYIYLRSPRSVSQNTFKN